MNITKLRDYYEEPPAKRRKINDDCRKIKKLIEQIEGFDHFLTDKLCRNSSAYLRREKTGLSSSFQVFLDQSGKINIIVHPKPKEIVDSGSFKKIRKSLLLEFGTEKIIECVTATPIYKPGESVKRQNETLTKEITHLAAHSGKRGIAPMIDWIQYPAKNGEPKLNIVFPKADCDLQTALIQGMTCTPSMLMDLVCGVDALHFSGVAHGDLKLDNVLVFGSRLMITDFGSCHPASKSDITGTRAYHSRGMNRYTELWIKKKLGKLTERELEEYKKLKSIIALASDIYALGLVCFSLLTGGEIPWIDKIDPFIDAKYPKRLIEACRNNQKVIEKGYKKLLKKVPQETRSPHFQIIMEMLDPDDEFRIKSPEILLRLQNIFGEDV
jgi:serine/threonine protein kinase